MGGSEYVSAWTIFCGVASILGLLTGIVVFTYAMAKLTPYLLTEVRKALRHPMGYQTPVKSDGNGHMEIIRNRETSKVAH